MYLAKAIQFAINDMEMGLIGLAFDDVKGIIRDFGESLGDVERQRLNPEIAKVISAITDAYYVFKYEFKMS